MTQLAPAPPSDVMCRSNGSGGASRHFGALMTVPHASDGEAGAVVVQRYQIEGPFVPKALSLFREETSSRKELRDLEHRAFDDLKITVSLQLSEIRRIREMNHPKNFRVRAAGLHGSALTRVVTNSTPQHERDVWFPSEQPRGVPSPPRAIQRVIPSRQPACLTELESEESDLREWMVRLESKLRQPIERGCVDSWFLLTAPQRLIYEEEDRRTEVLLFEERDWSVIMKRFKHLTPVTHFITVIRNAQEARLAELAANPLMGEDMDRTTITQEEERLRREMFQWLFDMYGVRLYSTARIEVRERCDIEEEEMESGVSVLLGQLCETEFRHARLALTALHAAQPHHKLLRDFFSSTL